MQAGLTLSLDTETGLPPTLGFHRLLSPREDVVGAAVRGLQSPANCVLAEEDVRAIVEVLVHECGW
jgi:hypothetical protein